MRPNRLTLIVLSAMILGLAAVARAQYPDQGCESVPLSATNRIGVLPLGAYPGDTAWASVYVQNDSMLAGFILILQYDGVLLTPLTSAGGQALLFERVGRLTSQPNFFLESSGWPGETDVIVAAFGIGTPETDSLIPGSDAVVRIPFLVNPAAAPGDSARFSFLRYTRYAVDSTVFPPDTIQSYCRGSQFSAVYGDPEYYVDVWPTADTSYLRITDQIPVILSFDGYPRSVWAGDSVRLFWNVAESDSATIDQGVGTFYTPTGSRWVFPDTTTQYSLTAYGGAATVEASVRIYVVPPGENRYPWLVPLAPVTATTDEDFSYYIFAYDPDNTPPIITASPLPPGLNFYDDGFGEALVTWTPTTDDIGVYPITVYATDRDDPALVDSQLWVITVAEANYPPEWDFNAQTVSLYERDTLSVHLTTYDSNGVAPSITPHVAGGLPLIANMTFVDSGNGSGLFTFVPDLFQGNANPALYYVGFTLRDAADPTLVVETAAKPIRVYNHNSGTEMPQLHVPDDTLLVVAEGDSLIFGVYATTSIGDLPVVSGGALPTGSSLGNAPGYTTNDHKIFRYYPAWDQAGEQQAQFIAANVDMVDTLTVTITVIQGNQAPWLFVPPSQPDTVTEGSTYYLRVTAFDPDSTVPSLYAALDGTDTLALNMRFVDSGNGSGVLIFQPNRLQGATPIPRFYYVKFRARDAMAPYPEALSATYTIRVYDSGLPCCVGIIGDVDYSGNGYGETNIADITRLVAFLFDYQTPLPCTGEADVDGGGVTVADLTALVAFLFSGGAAPPACP